VSPWNISLSQKAKARSESSANPSELEQLSMSTLPQAADEETSADRGYSSFFTAPCFILTA
jgi:hypothetical protein